MLLSCRITDAQIIQCFAYHFCETQSFLVRYNFENGHFLFFFSSSFINNLRALMLDSGT